MNTIKKADLWTCVGKVLGASGVNGLIKIQSFCQTPSDIEKYNPLKIDGFSKQISIKIIKKTRSNMKIHIPEINSRDKAEKLKGAFLFACKSSFPSTYEEEYYYVELIGTEVYQQNNTYLGTVQNVENYGAGSFLEVASDRSKEPQLIPFNHRFVLKVNLDQNQIIVSL